MCQAQKAKPGPPWEQRTSSEENFRKKLGWGREEVLLIRAMKEIVKSLKFLMLIANQIRLPLPLTACVASAEEVISSSSIFIVVGHLVGQKALCSSKKIQRP